MLLELKVSHFAVIDSLQVHFLRPGLNVLTGETGAGKSILLKSLALLLGGKASPDVIRTGHEQAIIEGSFDIGQRADIKQELKDLDLDSGDDSLVIRRIISQTGKHRLYINGHLSTLNVLEKTVPRLVEITGQHEHHTLTKPIAQLNVLDKFGELIDLRRSFFEKYTEARVLRENIETITAASKDREQKIDFLRFQISEIESFNPVLGEDQDLQSRHQRARFATRLHSYAQKGESVLYNQEPSVHAMLSDLVREGENLVELDPKLKPALNALKEASILAEDASFEFRDYSKQHQADEGEIERLEERVSNLKKLQKKYGTTVEEILEFKNRAVTECNLLEMHDENLKDLYLKINKINSELKSQATDLHKKRLKAAKQLETSVNRELLDLNMKGTEFLIAVKPLEELITTGGDEVLFLIKSASKDEPRPISKVASGGELSRLMLALKQASSTSLESAMTYLFDEVDTGVSGTTAEKVGRKLKSIGNNHQVICITHLPQVAAFADAHFLITKDVIKGHVKSDVTELNQKERVQELGRMISGEKITAASLTHAREMIESSSRRQKPTSPAKH
ncbi:MAG: DNA repair protein RecN [Oligoflexia bacterium]|nr:DNA repair protein RecN [Oligoflexia bacterium]